MINMTTTSNVLLRYIFTILCSCSSSSTLPLKIQSSNTQTDNKTFSFLALGDSYTVGQSVDRDQSWPFQLKKGLDSLNINIKTPTVIAKTGWTTRDLLRAIKEQAPSNHDLVSLLIGVNNQFQGKSFSKFKTEFDDLLLISKTLADTYQNVIVVSIPDYGVTPFGSRNKITIAKELDSYNTYMQQRCIENNIKFIDITTISRALETNDKALAVDNLHPSEYQYGLWVEKIIPVVYEILK